MKEIPIACSLTAAELDQRREVLAALQERCGPILLELTGPEGTADFLGAELGFKAGD